MTQPTQDPKAYRIEPGAMYDPATYTEPLTGQDIDDVVARLAKEANPTNDGVFVTQDPKHQSKHHPKPYERGYHDTQDPKPLDEILETFGDYGYHDSSYGDCQSCNKIKNAKQSIKALIANAEKQARIDELKRLQNDPKAIFETSNFTDNTKLLTIVLPQASITDRIKELEQS